MKGDSTVNQLMYLHSNICHVLNQGKEVWTVVCDISRAFDRVWHFWIKKSLGVKGHLLEWFLHIPLQGSKEFKILMSRLGVPSQPECPKARSWVLYFFLLILTTVGQINSKVKFFEDGTTLYIIFDTPETAAVCLNRDRNYIHVWKNRWLVSFNPSKILCWDKVSKWIEFQRSFHCLLARTSLEWLYFSYIRPLLEYGGIVLDNYTEELSKEIESQITNCLAATTKLIFM